MRTNRMRWFVLVLLVNIVVAILFALTSWLSKHGVVLPGHLIGAVVLFLPGLLLTLCVEQLTGRPVPSSMLVLWSGICSLTVIPGLVYYVDQLVLSGTGVLTPLTAFLTTWIALFSAFVVLVIVRRLESGMSKLRPSRKELWEIVLIVLGFVTVLLVNTSLYRFIPEADSYGYLIKLRDAAGDAEILVREPRVLFLTFVNTASALTGFYPYAVLKFGVPSLHLLLVCTIYLVTRPLVSGTAVRVLVALSPLSIPIVLQEMLISRPQSLVLLTLVPAMYLIARLSRARSATQLYWVLLLLGVGGMGMKIHTLIVLVLLLAIVGGLGILTPIFRTRPLDSLMVGGLVLLLASPWLRVIWSMSDIGHMVLLAWNAVSQANVTIWFLDHYRNVDGNEVGWPGWSWLLYYGYNLGFLMPLLLLAVFLSGKSKVFAVIQHLWLEWPAVLIALGMISIAEVFPRFELAYLPDRAWLLVMLCVSLLLPYLLVRGIGLRPREVWLWSLLLCCSIGMGSYVTYAKQGWVTAAEYAAVPFVQDTPPNAVFLGQGGSRPAIQYFADRRLVSPPSEVFGSDDEQVVERYLVQQQRASDVLLEQSRTNQVALGESFEQLGAEVARLQDQTQVATTRSKAKQLLGSLERGMYDEGLLKKEFVFQDQPIYILYDRTKFYSLYGQRAWWRSSNFYGADTNKFTRTYPLVYNEQGVMIWKVR